MSHYFEEDLTLKTHYRDINISIDGTSILLRSDSGVFSNKEVDKGSYIFVKTLLSLDLKGHVLDLGCGYGTVGICLNYFNKAIKLTYSDINPKCVELTSFNLKRYDLDGNCLQSDGYLNISESFDYIVFNPPISVGKEKIYRIYSDSKAHLVPGGKLYLVIRKDKGALSHMKYLNSIGFTTNVIQKEKGYLVIECL